MKKIILVTLMSICYLNIFGQEKIVDTDSNVPCPMSDGFYRYYLNDKKDSYMEGKVLNCYKVNTWQMVFDNNVEYLLEFNNGINYLEKRKAIKSNAFLLISNLNSSYDTLTEYYYDEFDNLGAKTIYWIDKSSIPKNISLTSENRLVKKQIRRIEIEYNPFYYNDNIIIVTEKVNDKLKSTKYYEGKRLEETRILFEYEDYNGKWSHGDKKSFLKFMKKELKQMKKSLE